MPVLNFLDGLEFTTNDRADGDGMHSLVKRRLLVICRSFGVTSEVWIQRQIQAFDAFDTNVLCWEWIRNGPRGEIQIPIHETGSDFDEPERTFSRWATRLMSWPDGNLRGATGAEKTQLIQRTRDIAPDVILCHFGHVALRCLPVTEKLGIPLVAHFHGLDISSSLRDRYYRWSLSRCLNRFAHAIVVGSHQQNVLCALGMDPEKISLIPCGAPTDLFLPKSDYASNTCRFITVSRLVPWKGLDITIRAFARAFRARGKMELHIVGSGPTESNLKQQVAALGMDRAILFHGRKSPEEVAALLQASDVFLQHSITPESGWEEGFGVSITEASACGLPVVVTRCGGIADQVSDGQNGYLVSQRDDQAMADRMLRLAGDQQLRETLGREGRKRAVEEFDSKVLAAKLQNRLLAIAAQQSRTIAGADEPDRQKSHTA